MSKRKRQSWFVKEEIDRLFQSGDQVIREFEQFEESKKEESSDIATKKVKQEVKPPRPFGPYLALTLSHLNGSFIGCDQIASLVHYAIFGQNVEKPKWANIVHPRSVLQTLVLRINCPNDFVETLPLPYVENFFERSWIQTNADVRNREKFWNRLMNVPISAKDHFLKLLKKDNERLEELGHRDRTNYMLTDREMAMMGFPFPTSDNVVPTKEKYRKVTSSSPMFAIDCEMCKTDMKDSELTRISIVNEAGDVLLDTLVKPRNKIIDYLTPHSGITKELMKGVKTRIEDVQKAVQRILPPDAILIGHSMEYDLNAMKMSHPYCIDISLRLNYANSSSKHSKDSSKNSLKDLTRTFLFEAIQCGGNGHCSYEDAWATMKLIQIKLEKGVDFGMTRAGWDYKKWTDTVYRPPVHVDNEKTDHTPPSCSKCSNSTMVECVVANCPCFKANGPSLCVQCTSLEESEEGDFDWKESLPIDATIKTIPISKKLKSEKNISVTCAFDCQDLEIERVSSKRVKLKEHHKFENYEKFVENTIAEMMNDALIMVELDHEKLMPAEAESSEEETKEQPNLASIVNEKLEKLISSTCFNSLILVVLACETKSIMYAKVRNRQE